MTLGIKSVFTKEYAKVLEVLLRARKTRGLTQQAVAKALGKPQSFVSKYESGERRIDLVEFFCIVRALGEDPLVLLAEMEFLEQPSSTPPHMPSDT